jgi:hypothetical protein
MIGTIAITYTHTYDLPIFLSKSFSVVSNDFAGWSLFQSCI